MLQATCYKFCVLRINDSRLPNGCLLPLGHPEKKKFWTLRKYPKELCNKNLYTFVVTPGRLALLVKARNGISTAGRNTPTWEDWQNRNTGRA